VPLHLFPQASQSPMTCLYPGTICLAEYPTDFGLHFLTHHSHNTIALPNAARSEIQLPRSVFRGVPRWPAALASCLTLERGILISIRNYMLSIPLAPHSNPGMHHFRWLCDSNPFASLLMKSSRLVASIRHHQCRKFQHTSHSPPV